MKFLKSNWFNILLLVFIALLIIPQTRKPIQVGLNRLISFSPSEIEEEKRDQLDDYNWWLRDINDRPVNFAEARGEVSIVNFWATWCPPCIAEMPSFQSVYKEYGGRVNFYFVSSEEREKLKRFIEKRGYTFPVYQPVSRIPEKLESNSLPTTFVISGDGEIVMRETGAAKWDSSGFKDLLNDLLTEN